MHQVEIAELRGTSPNTKLKQLEALGGGVVGDPATAHDGVMADAKTINKKVKLIFKSCGSLENPDCVNENIDLLKEHGINAVSYVSPDTAHDWMTWRRSFYQFAPMIFN